MLLSKFQQIYKFAAKMFSLFDIYLSIFNGKY